MTSVLDLEWIDGAGFVDWLTARGLTPKQIDHAHGSLAAKWKRGAMLSVWKADEILVRHDIHLSELPEELYRPNPHLGKRALPYSEKFKAKVLADVDAGASLEAAARKHGCHARSIRAWKRARDGE